MEGEISCQTSNCFLKRLCNWRVAPSARVVQYTWCKRPLQTTQLYRHNYTNWNQLYVQLHEHPSCDLRLLSKINTCSLVPFQVLASKIKNLPVVSVNASYTLNESCRKLAVAWFQGIRFAIASLSPCGTEPGHLSVGRQGWFTLWDEPWFTERLVLSQYWFISLGRLLVTGWGVCLFFCLSKSSMYLSVKAKKIIHTCVSSFGFLIYILF